MNNVKIPGVLWVILIVVGVAVAHTYLKDPFIFDLVVIVAGMILKTLNLGTAEENQALDIIELISKRLRAPVAPVPPSDQQMRGPTSKSDSSQLPSPTLTPDPALPLVVPPPRPNTVARWLVG